MNQRRAQAWSRYPASALLLVVVFLGCSQTNAEPSLDGRGGRLLDARRGLTDVRFSVNTSRGRRPISPFIYGVNADAPIDAYRARFYRIGGNRWSTYNWEINASNAGSDYFHQNDDYLGGGTQPGEAVRSRYALAKSAGATGLITVPMAGLVAKDKFGDGDISLTKEFKSRRLAASILTLPVRSNRFRRSSLFPDSTDEVVNQAEFISWLVELAGADPLFLSLDNEPALWPSTHPRIHPHPVRYDELIGRSIELATAIRVLAPGAMVFGPVSYGFQEMVNLQSAPDARGRDFLEVYLREMKEAHRRSKRRLLDVLDVHWYPEVRAGETKVLGQDGGSPELIAARVMAPRSLWDPKFVEESWITDYLGGPIRLIPRLREKIDRVYPGTRLAVTEYSYGGGAHISGAVAQAEVLGIFGREGVFAAALWAHGQSDTSFIQAAFRMFLDFDGQGAHFGDTSVEAGTNDPDRTSLYASIEADHPNRMVVVTINRSNDALRVELVIEHPERLRVQGEARLEGDRPVPSYPVTKPESIGPNRFIASLPPMSVTTYSFAEE
ncbi:MAG: endoglucanase A [Deltaproteobacteria bacterium]|nr:endoglucanase A [Deltaproteobacteria bacterium]